MPLPPCHPLDPVRLVALLGLAVSANAQERASLVHRPSVLDDVILPDETWHDVGDTLELNGVRFTIAQTEPETLGIDTDADGEIDAQVPAQGGRVVLSAGPTTRRRTEVSAGKTPGPAQAPQRLGPPVPANDTDLPDSTAHPTGSIAGPVEVSAPFTYEVRLRRNARGWQWTSSGCLVARVGGEVLRLFDQDGNGKFADFGIDALAVGDAPAATMLSRVISLNGKLMGLEVERDAREVRITPFEGPTGFVNAKEHFESTGKLVSAIVQDGDLSFDLAAGKGALELPAGNYRLVGGIAVAGDESVHIRAGRMAPVRVDAGGRVTLAWGAPLNADFNYRVDAGTIVVDPDVNFYGRAGEEYHSFWPCVKSPHLSIKNRVTGQRVQSGHFGGSCGGGLSRFEAGVPEGVPLEVQLEHWRDLFGKITGSSHSSNKQASSR